MTNAGADVNAKDDEGWTQLHSASRGGRLDVAVALIKAGADVNAKTNNGGTPLCLALKSENTELAKVLREAGAVS